MEPHLYHVQNESLKDLIPKDRFFEMIHQMVVLDVDMCIYLFTAETGVLFRAVLYCPNSIKNEAEVALVQTSSGMVSWAHQGGSIQKDAAEDDAAALNSKHSFLHGLNELVKKEVPMQLVRKYRRSVQLVYSKVKGGVEGSTQYRACLKNSGSYMRGRVNTSLKC